MDLPDLLDLPSWLDLLGPPDFSSPPEIPFVCRPAAKRERLPNKPRALVETNKHNDAEGDDEEKPWRSW